MSPIFLGITPKFGAMNWPEELKTLLKRYEALLFWSCAAVFIAPLWLASGIYTYDGPAHLYNARQMWEIIFENNAWLSHYYALNTGPDNWLVHGLLMFLQAAFGAVLAEKIWFTLYVFVFILGFRNWMLYMQQTALSWWVFVLPYFFNVLMGQYSFALSVALLPYFMLNWQRFLSTAQRRSLVWSAVFLFLLYLTHVVSFGVAGLAAGMLCLFQGLGWGGKRPALLYLAGIAWPGLLLSLLFVSRNAEPGATQWLPLAERIQYVLDARALIGYSYSEDVAWSRLLSVLFVVLLLPGLWKNRKNKTGEWGWLVIWVVVLVLNLVAPDQSAGGGFIQTRLNILLLVFSIALLASFRKMQWGYALSVPLVLFLAIRLGAIHTTANENLVAYRADWEAAAELIPAESSMVTFNYSPLWFQHHIHTIIGQDKPIVHTSNYEADNNYFPLRWQSDSTVQNWLGVWAATKSLQPCNDPLAYDETHLPDYLIVYFYTFGEQLGCTAPLDLLRHAAYAKVPIYSSTHLQLYKRL